MVRADSAPDANSSNGCSRPGRPRRTCRDRRRARARKGRSEGDGSAPTTRLRPPLIRWPFRASRLPISGANCFASPSAAIAGPSSSVCRTSRSRAVPRILPSQRTLSSIGSMRLRRKSGPVDLERGPQPPQRNPALMHAFDVEIEAGAVVVRGQVRKRVENDKPERISGDHLGHEAELWGSRPVPTIGSVECIAYVGLGAGMQTSVDRVADPLRFPEQSFSSPATSSNSISCTGSSS